MKIKKIILPVLLGITTMTANCFASIDVERKTDTVPIMQDQELVGYVATGKIISTVDKENGIVSNMLKTDEISVISFKENGTPVLETKTSFEKSSKPIIEMSSSYKLFLEIKKEVEKFFHMQVPFIAYDFTKSTIVIIGSEQQETIIKSMVEKLDGTKTIKTNDSADNKGITFLSWPL